MKKTSKVYLVFLNGKSNAGGAERMVHYLDEYLKSREIQTQIIDEDFLKNTFVGKLYWKLFNRRHFEKRRAKYIARFITAYLWLNYRPNKIVISNGEPTAYYPTDYVISHGCFHKMELDYGRKDSKFSRVAKLQMIACRNARKIIAVESNVKNDLIKYYGINKDKITVVPNCIDRNNFYPIKKQTTDFKTIAYIGRLEYGKGIAELQELAKLVEMQHDWKLLITCNNSSNTELFTNLNKTQVLVGLTIDTINELAYSKADIIFYPSYSESFGMVTIEALACGKPIAGNAVGVLPKLVEEKQPGAYLLPKLINEDIFRFFDNCIEDSNKFSPEEIHQQAMKKFSIESYFEQMDQQFFKTN
ncbi:glycosyltransferase involved in cell wall biosynthesis [Flavobacterium nitrogenifigens]|uniref:Glycosyltransferase involved in cell wall biosynthesis n=2 Tax=Flavobacterium TaxID=237 RepID=A0A7W7N5N5_9FLAO|nr:MULTISPECIES: glycosyltransferase family 4 protein [Flavobacterium]MBB4800945.1 glycosyltransferase involved in cell wall biosynthesis [Flavobacterium nitrogenifigens]MBB6385307.1 glycosyltransferase involved in cell wall biosynthesis [Flavobacterium notoginsengisoli]